MDELLIKEVRKRRKDMIKCYVFFFPNKCCKNYIKCPGEFVNEGECACMKWVFMFETLLLVSFYLRTILVLI